MVSLKKQWQAYNKRCVERGEDKVTFAEWRENRATITDKPDKKDKKLKSENLRGLFFFKGFGSTIREKNINAVKGLVEQGYTLEQIIKHTRKWFRSQTIEQYYQIAIEEIEDER